MIGDRLREFVNYTGLSNRAFSKKTDTSPAFVTDAGKSIRTDKLVKIMQAFPQLNSKWLLTGEGTMIDFSDKENEKSIAVNKDNIAFNVGNVTPIPLVNVFAVGGDNNDAFSINDDNVKDYYLIPKFKYSKVDFMIEVKGDSMAPRYKSGDIVACCKLNSRAFLQWNHPHVIATREQGILIKRIMPSKQKNGFVSVVADNPNYPPYDIPESEVISMALVVGGVTLE